MAFSTISIFPLSQVEIGKRKPFDNNYHDLQQLGNNFTCNYKKIVGVTFFVRIPRSPYFVFDAQMGFISRFSQVKSRSYLFNTIIVITINNNFNYQTITFDKIVIKTPTSHFSQKSRKAYWHFPRFQWFCFHRWRLERGIHLIIIIIIENN